MPIVRPFLNLFLAVAVALNCAAASADTSADQLRATLFAEAGEALAAADQARASLLAPKSYRSAAEHYRRAEELLERGKGIDRIREELADAVVDFRNALKATKVADFTLATALQARADADNAEAESYARELWQEAEEAFTDGAMRLEDDNLKSAQRYAKKAEGLYREAELTAIKSNYLNETRDLLARAEDLKAKRYAPVTLASAKGLLAEAEQQLNENRYDTDRPRSLAKSAKHQAKLAIYLAENLTRVKKKKLSMEDVVLDWQTPLQRIGAAIDLPVYFDDGHEAATNNIIGRLEDIQKVATSADLDRSEQQRLVKDLQRQIADLETRLGGVSQERLALNLQLERQAAIRAKFREVEQMFDREEAIVLRSGNDVILRLVGLTFDSGQAVIKPERFELLTKVKKAIRVFEKSTLVIEGHTDAFGGDEVNLTLSEQRAEATKSYLLANMQLKPDRVMAVGYGESQPVANNETPEGRAKNRRIDVVIKPTL